MTGRELVFSNPMVIRTITERFVPVADDVSRLQVSDDEVSRFFRSVAVQGHMRGRSRPEVSHQGIYAFTANGTELASGNPLRSDKTLDLLETALERWEMQEERPDESSRPLAGGGAEQAYPAPGGAVLRMSARDLPRPDGLPAGLERYATQWNFDHVWLRPDDVRAFLPESMEVGADRVVPQSLLARIGRFHLCDIVRGEPRVWGPEAVDRFDLTVRVAGIDDSRATLVMNGAVVLRERVSFRDSHKPVDWSFENLLDAVVVGKAVWNIAEQRFERFDVLVAGQREGAHRYNVRTADPGPAPIGFAFELAGDAPWERTPPHAMRTWTRPGERSVPVATVVTGESYYGSPDPGAIPD